MECFLPLARNPKLLNRAGSPGSQYADLPSTLSQSWMEAGKCPMLTGGKPGNKGIHYMGIIQGDTGTMENRDYYFIIGYMLEL